VANNSQVTLRATASATAGATVSCSVEIGGVVDQFRVTTSAPSGGGNAGGGSSGGGGGGALDRFAVMCLALLTLMRKRARARRDRSACTEH